MGVGMGVPIGVAAVVHRSRSDSTASPLPVARQLQDLCADVAAALRDNESRWDSLMTTLVSARRTQQAEYSALLARVEAIRRSLPSS